MKALWRSST
jgi:hypothetical protein